MVPPMVIEVAWPRKAMPMKLAIACWRCFIGTRSPMSASETGMVAAANIAGEGAVGGEVAEVRCRRRRVPWRR